MSAGRTHFIGIGGIGMSAIARVLLQRGEAVSGSDRTATALTDRLAAEGATITIGHRAESVEGASLVVVSSAIPVDSPEVARARELGIPIIKRAEMLGRLTRKYRSILVAGTHGKTTTSAMVSFVLAQTGLDPTVLVGGELLDLDTNGVAGTGSYLVAEADEYDSSFLRMSPWTAVVTNVEADHLDHFGSFDRLRAAFADFLRSVPEDGYRVVCTDDPEVRQILHDAQLPAIGYGFETGAAWRVEDARLNALGTYDFTATHNGQPYARISLLVPGQHNVLNALAACAVASLIGVPGDAAAAALAAFHGAKRRFEHKGTFAGAEIFDDYAHHPTEIRATLRAARERFPSRRIVVLFQPHTYSRTKHLLNEFAASFSDADTVILTDIYAAREHDDLGISTADLVSAMRPRHPSVEHAPSLDDAEQLLRTRLSARDVLFTIGAGDVYRVAERLTAS